MSDEEFDRKIQQLRNEGYDDFADAINGLRAEITAERQASEREVADGLEFRNHIAALLPESWYADLPVGKRIRLLVEQWRKLHVSHVELTAERDGLRKQFHTQAEQRDFVGKLVDNMPHARIAAEFKEFKAEVADALATMEHALRPDLFRPGFYEAAMEIIGVTREQLGIAPGKDEASDKPMPDCPKCGNNSEVRRAEFRPQGRDSLCPAGAAFVSTMPAPSGFPKWATGEKISGFICFLILINHEKQN